MLEATQALLTPRPPRLALSLAAPGNAAPCLSAMEGLLKRAENLPSIPERPQLGHEFKIETASTSVF